MHRRRDVTCQIIESMRPKREDNETVHALIDGVIARNRTTPAILKEMTDDFNVSQTAAMTLIKGLHDVVPAMQKREEWGGVVCKGMDELAVVSHCKPWGCDWV